MFFKLKYDAHVYTCIYIYWYLYIEKYKVYRYCYSISELFAFLSNFQKWKFQSSYETYENPKKVIKLQSIDI